MHGSHRRAIPLSETIEAWILIFGFIAALFLLKTDLIAGLIAVTHGFTWFAAFLSGLFFTSMLTTVPAIVALSEVSLYIAAWKVALFGALGSVVGDLFIFRFIRSRLVERIVNAAFDPRIRRIGSAIIMGRLWWIAPLLGVIVIASPLPDELGLLMLGLSHLKLRQFVPLAFLANGIGILMIALATQNL